MKTLSEVAIELLEDEMGGSPAIGMGASSSPAIAVGTGDIFQGDYKFGSGDLMTTPKKKKKEILEAVESNFKENKNLIRMYDIIAAYDKLTEHWYTVNSGTITSDTIKKTLVSLDENIDTFYSVISNNKAYDTEIEIEVDIDKLKGKKLGSVIRGTSEWKELKKLADEDVKYAQDMDMSLRGIEMITRQQILDFIEIVSG